mgnify:FL=1
MRSGSAPDQIIANTQVNFDFVGRRALEGRQLRAAKDRLRIVIKRDGTRCGAKFNAPHRAIWRGDDAHTNQALFAEFGRVPRVAQIILQPTIKFALPFIRVIRTAHFQIGHAKRRVGHWSRREIQLIARPIALLPQPDGRQMRKIKRRARFRAWP